jgi:hypothetical protein
LQLQGVVPLDGGLEAILKGVGDGHARSVARREKLETRRRPVI